MAQKNGTHTLTKLWHNEIIKTLLLVFLVVSGVLVFRTLLTTSLKTDFPLHTPISSSMASTLNIGDLLIVQGIDNIQEINADPTKGDIIVFRRPGDPEEFIVHRAIEMKNDGESYLITKGDNNLYSDGWKIRESDIIGEVIWRMPFLGYIKIFLTTPFGIIISAILFIILFFFGSLDKDKSR
jgi:signal peptidase